MGLSACLYIHSDPYLFPLYFLCIFGNQSSYLIAISTKHTYISVYLYMSECHLVSEFVYALANLDKPFIVVCRMEFGELHAT